MKSSSCILILRIVKKELSCTGVVPATEPPMPKLEWVTQEKLCLVSVSVSVCLCACMFRTLFPSGASVYIYLQAFFSFFRWNIKGDIYSFFVTSRRWATGELFFQTAVKGSKCSVTAPRRTGVILLILDRRPSLRWRSQWVNRPRMRLWTIPGFWLDPSKPIYSWCSSFMTYRIGANYDNL